MYTNSLRRMRPRAGTPPILAVGDGNQFLNLFNLMLIWGLFTSAVPFAIVFAFPAHPHKGAIAAGLAVAVLILTARGRVAVGNPMILIILACQIVVLCILAFAHDLRYGLDLGYARIAIQLIAVAVLYVYIVTMYSSEKLMASFVYAMSIMCILGVLAFWLGIFGYLSPLGYFENGDGRANANFGLAFSNASFTVGSSTVIRIGGYFDEPGTMAYYTVFALLVNRLYLQSRWAEGILITGGLFTLSLAFYVSLVVYGIAFWVGRNGWVRATLWLVPLIGIALYVQHSKEQSTTHAVVYAQTLGRFEVIDGPSGPRLAGDNRSRLMSPAWHAFSRSPLIGQGASWRQNARNEFSQVDLSSNPLAPFAMHGIIGAITIFLPFLYWTMLVWGNGPSSRALLGAWVVILVNFMQRPVVLGGLFGYFAVIMLIEATTRWRALEKDRRPIRFKPARA